VLVSTVFLAVLKKQFYPFMKSESIASPVENIPTSAAEADRISDGAIDRMLKFMRSSL
jgi:hypothetical protein